MQKAISVLMLQCGVVVLDSNCDSVVRDANDEATSLTVEGHGYDRCDCEPAIRLLRSRSYETTSLKPRQIVSILHLVPRTRRDLSF